MFASGEYLSPAIEQKAELVSAEAIPSDEGHDMGRGCWVPFAAVLGFPAPGPDDLAQGGAADATAPGAVLAGLAGRASDPAVLPSLSDDQLLGLVSTGRRMAGWAAWVQQAAIAEFAARRLALDPGKSSALGFTAFSPDELAPELVTTGNYAELRMAQSREAVTRLPACTELLRDGRIGEYQMKIIIEATGCLSDQDAAEADRLLAAAAAGLTPARLRAMCTRVVMMIDPEAAGERKQAAAKQARITRWQEDSGNAALSGRELPPDEVLAASQHIDATARTLRAGGLPGSLQQLRVRAYLDLTRGLNPLDRLTAPGGQATGGQATSGQATSGQATSGQATSGHAENAPAGQAGDVPDGGTGGSRDGDRRPPVAWDDWPDEDDSPEVSRDSGNDGTACGASPAQGARSGDHDGNDPHDDDNDIPPSSHGDRDGMPDGGPHGSGLPGSGTHPTGARPGKAPVKAVINLLVPIGTLLGWSSAPGEIPGFGILDPQTTCDLVEAASRHPGTRYCTTVIGPDGTAVAHGCAPGQHPWQPGQAGPLGQTGPPESGQQNPGASSVPGPAEQGALAAEFLRWLHVDLSPIAKGTCDHRHYSPRYVISRKVKHLIQARASTCTAPGCNRPAAGTDADHTVSWPAGPSCECNLGAPCRYHHRNKQAPGWHLDQPEPGVFRWRNPSGRAHTTHPTRYVT
jgi:Domain of unknown function (DUF222)